jgi:CheY-like chemotaxis protein
VAIREPRHSRRVAGAAAHVVAAGQQWREQGLAAQRSRVATIAPAGSGAACGRSDDTELCLLQEAQMNAWAKTTPEPVLSRGHGERVLVVEDNAALRRSVSVLLRALNYQALTAASARAALRILEDQPVDLLFTDLMMPGGMDGLTLARQARERWPDLKVLLTSGLAGGTARERFGAGLDAYPLLEKPYRMRELANKLRDILGT